MPKGKDIDIPNHPQRPGPLTRRAWGAGPPQVTGRPGTRGTGGKGGGGKGKGK